LVSDYGLVQMLWVPTGQSLAKVNPRYAAPELVEGRLTSNSDQYSLALIYQEMLTGQLPFRPLSRGEPRRSRGNTSPKLDWLPACDREIVRRALASDPRDRYPSCTDFVEALLAQTLDAKPATVTIPVPGTWPASVPPVGTAPIPTGKVVAQLVQVAATNAGVREFRGLRYRLGNDGVLYHKCAAWLPGGVARQKMEGFLQKWKAQVIACEQSFLVFHICVAQDFWQRWGRQKRYLLEIRVEVAPARPPSKLTELTVRMEVLGGPLSSRRKLLEQHGPLLTADLNTFLVATPERRIEERYAFSSRLAVAPFSCQAAPLTPVECLGKDISLSGIGFLMPSAPTGSEIFIYPQSRGETPPLAIPAAVTRVCQTEDGLFEAGARFLLAPGR
jgi:hypothetical protein